MRTYTYSQAYLHYSTVQYGTLHTSALRHKPVTAHALMVCKHNVKPSSG